MHSQTHCASSNSHDLARNEYLLLCHTSVTVLIATIKQRIIPFATSLVGSLIYRVYTVGTRSNSFKSVGVGAKDSPLMPPVIQETIMFGTNVADIARDVSTSTMSPINCTTVIYAAPEEDRVVVGYINEWINAYSFISSKYHNCSPTSRVTLPSADKSHSYRLSSLLSTPLNRYKGFHVTEVSVKGISLLVTIVKLPTVGYVAFSR